MTIESEFCISALESALRRYDRPDIFNTDQGSQFTSNEFTGTLKNAGILVSMDGRGRAMDNIFIERLWRTVKYEEVYLKEYVSVLELIQALRVYFVFYNEERPHDGLRGNTPAQVYWECLQLAA